MNSPYGRRGEICAHYGWTWEYLHTGIAWDVVQRIIADSPKYDFDCDGKNESFSLTEDNEKEFVSMLCERVNFN